MVMTRHYFNKFVSRMLKMCLFYAHIANWEQFFFEEWPLKIGDSQAPTNCQKNFSNCEARNWSKYHSNWAFCPNLNQSVGKQMKCGLFVPTPVFTVPPMILQEVHDRFL